MAIVHKSLDKHGFPVGALHGDMDQSARMASLDAFKNGAVDILVCSDVAARGLDIPDVSHVFNFDVPTHSEDYVHRIGRTGRAGRLGAAFTLVTSDDGKYVAQIEDLIKRKIDWHGPGLNELAEPQHTERDRERASRSGDRSRRNARGSSERGSSERGPSDRPARAPRAPRNERAESAANPESAATAAPNVPNARRVPSARLAPSGRLVRNVLSETSVQPWRRRKTGRLARKTSSAMGSVRGAAVIRSITIRR